MALCKSLLICCSPFQFHRPVLLNHHLQQQALFFQNTIISSRRRHPTTPFSAISSSAPASMENPPDGYRRNVGICLMNPSSKKVFAASRLDIPGAWQMPQGGIDENEEPRNAAIRELREETGVISADIIAEAPHWLTYDFPPDVREKLRNQWGSDWKGQAQKWFLFNFSGNDTEVNLLGDGTEKPEFGEWAWISPQEIVNNAVDFKKPVYSEVMLAFTPYFQ